eukprot:m.125536 g.125536  ORF g.125536 m.125536 type:complete len:203 (-) comp29135_c1_seq2:103-711(-)
MPRSNVPGSSFKDFNGWDPQDMNDMESSLQCQQYIQQLIRMKRNNAKAIVELPTDQDENVWKCEHLRQICCELNGLVIALEPTCTPQAFPEMITSPGETFLNAAYTPPKSTDAMTYIVNTLDYATSELCNDKNFPSRVTIPDTSLKFFKSISRRLYRVFAHAHINHRPAFDKFEGSTFLYKRFHALMVTYDLMANDQMTIQV